MRTIKTFEVGQQYVIGGICRCVCVFEGISGAAREVITKWEQRQETYDERILRDRLRDAFKDPDLELYAAFREGKSYKITINVFHSTDQLKDELNVT